jgi:hypothetical protein
MTALAGSDVALRVVLVRPPAGVRFRLQRGRHELVAPASATAEEIVCDLEVRAVAKPDGGVDFRGPFVQGKPGERFVYVCSGTSAGQPDSCWTRRMKVPLAGITREMADEAVRDGRVLRARFAGTAGDGGPACATCRPLDGWSLVAG